LTGNTPSGPYPQFRPKIDTSAEPESGGDVVSTNDIAQDGAEAENQVDD